MCVRVRRTEPHPFAGDTLAGYHQAQVGLPFLVSWRAGVRKGALINMYILTALIEAPRLQPNRGEWVVTLFGEIKL